MASRIGNGGGSRVAPFRQAHISKALQMNPGPLSTRMVRGARAAPSTAPEKTDPFNAWVNQLRQRRGFNLEYLLGIVILRM